MQRVSSHQALDLTGKRGVAAQRETGVDPPLKGSDLHGLKPGHLSLGEGIVTALAEYRTAHEHQRVTQGRRRTGETPVPQGGLGHRQHPLETIGVHLAIERPQLIARRLPLETLAARHRARRGQGPAKPGDIGVQRAPGA